MRNRIVRSPVMMAVLGGVGMLPLTGAAQAQEENPSDIVVTAKNREEKLQDVPLAITALSTADLEDNQIRDVKDLQKVTPNLNLYSGGGRTDASAWSMRGLAPNTSDERYQGISIFLDGIALSGQLTSIDMDNVERVEVIKGPQSATFGRATYSGAINFVTREPSGDRISGKIRARASIFRGSDEPNYNLTASLSLPVVQDHLWLSVSGTSYRNGRVTTARDSGQAIGRERTDVATATLFWKPDETLSVSLRGLYTHDRDSIGAQVIQQPRDWLQAGIPLVTLPRGGGAFLPQYMPDPDLSRVGDKGVAGVTRDRYFGSLIVSKKMGDYELSYRGGYFKSKDYRNTATFPRATGAGQDPVFGSVVGVPGGVTLDPTANAVSRAYEDFENTSQQLMLLSPGNRPFRWRIGGYYFWENDRSYFGQYVTATNPIGQLTYQTLENFSAFGGFDWTFAQGLTLSGEGRIAREIVRYPICTYCFRRTFSDEKRSSTDFSPRVTLSYKITPENMVYALYSRGVKSGRFSNITVAGQDTVSFAEPEELQNYEIGSKNAFFDNRLVLNLSGFYDRVKNQQLTSTSFFVAPNGSTAAISATNNVGKSEIWGFEVETSLKVTSRFLMEGSLGLARQRFVNSDPVLLAATSAVGFPGAVGSPIVMAGKTQGSVPWWNGFIAGQYAVPVEYGDLKFRLDANYRGKYYTDLANLSAVKSAWTVNGRATFSHEAWDFTVFGRNLLNNKRSTGSGLGGGTAVCGFVETNRATYGTAQQCLYSSPPRPFEVGLELAYKF